MSQAWGVLKRMFTSVKDQPPELEAKLAGLRSSVPAPVFWLLGKTQSGKTSIIRSLTGAEDAVIGSGFRPTTKTSRQYQFPTADAPLLSFLDTRGVDEPGYDPAEDITAFERQAHMVVVTAKATDFAQGNIRAALEPIRNADPGRPVVLAVTCLHEAFPRQSHPDPYPFDAVADGTGPLPELSEPYIPLLRAIERHREAFAGLFDAVVPIDLTRPDEGFADPNYGGDALKRTLLRFLPVAYRQTLLRLKEATDVLKDLHLRHAVPVIVGYASLAATAGAIPIPFVDLLLIPGIQTRMVNHLAGLYGQPLTGERFREMAASLGLGIAARQAVREVAKLIPYVGSAAGAALAWASTYALGRAFCYYYQSVHEGHVPDAAALKRFYHEQLDSAARNWKHARTDPAAQPGVT
jgi:uncharacterized protein (DUF697 family)